MKREFLEGLGIDKDTIDKIMTENGNDINREKEKADGYLFNVILISRRFGQQERFRNIML